MSVLLALVAIVYVVIVPTVAFVALRRTARLRQELSVLQTRLGQHGPASEPKAPLAAAEDAPEKRRSSEPLISSPAQASDTVSADAGEEAVAPPAGASGPAGRWHDPASTPTPLWGKKIPGGEKIPADGEYEMTSKWLVWAGGIALALGGIFLARYAIGVGVLTPLVRIVLGLIAGAAMVSAGEATRRWSVTSRFRIAGSDRVPAILSGAGLITLFASVYAADSFYGLIPPPVTFVLLVVLSLGALALALLHGPALGLLGLAGAMVVPLLVQTDAPSPWTLFLYLGFVASIMIAAAHYRNWSWLGWTALGGSAAWVLVWLAGGPGGDGGGDHVPVGLFVVYIAALPLGFATYRLDGGAPFHLAGYVRTPLFVWSAVASAMAFFTLRVWAYDLVSLLVLAALAGLYLASAWRAPVRLGLVFTSAVAVLAGLASWDVPALVPEDFVPGLDVFGAAPLPAPAFEKFAYVAFGFAALYFAVGLAAIGRVRFANIWAALSAGLPAIILFLAYWRWLDFDTNQSWSAIGLGLAAVNVAAASRFTAARGPLGAYAVATIAGLSLAFAMTLQEAWLTVALALQLPAIAMISTRLDLKPLRYVALVIAGIAMARLLLNPYLLSYPLGATPVFNWILYGYGIPAIAFWLAARRLLTVKDDSAVQVLEAGAIAFVTCLVSFQIRHGFVGSLGAEYDDLWEISLHSAVWIALSYALYASGALSRRPVLKWASAILRAAGAAQIVFMHVLVLNPAVSPIYVGEWPLFNVLGLAYLLPAIFAIAYVRAAQEKSDDLTALIAGGFAVGLIFIYLSMEVMRGFRGSLPYLSGPSEAERYAYSVVWLIYACALLGLGLWRGNRLIRLVALGVLLVTTLKVFVFDMSNLTGALRAVSFLGLGVVLIAIGYIYQRFIQPHGPRDAPAAAPDRPPDKTGDEPAT